MILVNTQNKEQKKKRINQKGYLNQFYECFKQNLYFAYKDICIKVLIIKFFISAKVISGLRAKL